MLRDCHYWRALAPDPLVPWTESQAAARIHYDELPPPSPGPNHAREQLIALRPFCLLWADTAGGFTTTLDAMGGCCSTKSGTFIYQIELPVPSALATTPSALAEHLTQVFGRIMESCDFDKPGMVELSRLPGYLPIKSLALRGYVRTDQKAAIELGDAVVAEIECRWGND
jgi:hypothetical protein